MQIRTGPQLHVFIQTKLMIIKFEKNNFIRLSHFYNLVFGYIFNSSFKLVFLSIPDLTCRGVGRLYYSMDYCQHSLTGDICQQERLKLTLMAHLKSCQI